MIPARTLKFELAVAAAGWHVEWNVATACRYFRA
jgi:hypothetical protein